MILRWNGGAENNALLRRNGVDRPCTAGVLDFSPAERQLISAGAKRVAISAYGLAVAPHHELDKVVLFGEVLRILQPPKGPRADGLPVFYDCACEYDSQA